MKTTITKVTAVFLAILFSTVIAYSQTIVTSVPTINRCPGQTGPLNVDVTVSNFTNIGSISMKLVYNPAVLTYTGLTGNSALSVGTTIQNASNGNLMVAWFTLGSVNLADNSVLFTFNFNYLGGTTNLHWDTISNGGGDNLYSDPNADPLPAIFISGGVTVTAAPYFNLNPANIATVPGGNAVYTATTIEAANYQWQESQDGGSNWANLSASSTYSDVTTNTLTITGVTAGMNNYLYRCVATEAVCNLSTPSYPAMLTVDAGCILPLQFTITGGGSYCVDALGVLIGLDNSETGVNYQLFRNGSYTGIDLAGTGSAISFGLLTTAGTYTCTAYNTCGSTAAAGTALVTVLPLPFIFSVTGNGSYCAGGSGLAIGLDGSDAGTDYELYLNGLLVGSPIVGTGSAISFGLQTEGGDYTIKGTNTCGYDWMYGIATITINQLPVVYTLDGGGTICPGGAGLPITLNGSEYNTTYTLFLDGVSTGQEIAGTGFNLDFGFKTAAGIYTVSATSVCGTSVTTTGVTIIAGSLPTVFNVGGTGAYCAGSPSAVVTLDGSTANTYYGLYLDGAVDGYIVGTGAPLTFGPFSIAGTYTIVATNASGCISDMAGSATLSWVAEPTVFNVTGGGSFCEGQAGMPVGLDGSLLGIDYQLYNSGTALAILPGTGAALDFGLQTVNGTYYVVSMDACGSHNNSGTVDISNNPLPMASIPMTGGGTICAGSNAPLGLMYSEPGVVYTLFFEDGTSAGVITGDGGEVYFGSVTTAGTYHAEAHNTCGTVTIDNTVSVAVVALPLQFNLTGGGHVCSDATTVSIGLDNTQTGVEYILFRNGNFVGSMPGTGLALEFGAYNTAGSYSAIGQSTTDGNCSVDMIGTTFVIVDNYPTVYTISGGGVHCPAGSGVSVSLSNSQPNVDYVLYANGVPTAQTLAGTGSAITFSGITTAGYYEIHATVSGGYCADVMDGIAYVTSNAPLAITAGPDASSIASGATTSFTVFSNFSFSDLAYQWQISTDDGNSFSNLIDGIYYSGVNTYTLTIVNTPTSFSGSQYRCIVTDPACSQELTSLAALLTVTPTSTINVYLPTLTGITPGSTVSISVTAENIDNVNAVSLSYLYDNTILTYQGYSNVNPAFSAGVPLLNDLAGNFNFSWFDITPISISSGTLFTVDFTFNGGNSALTWDLVSAGVCEFTDINDNILPANFVDGSISGCLLPVAYTISGGGAFCAGAIGSQIYLDKTQTNTNYAVYVDGVANGVTFQGNGNGMNFPFNTAGVYTIVGTNSCGSQQMNASATITVFPVPTAYSVVGDNAIACATGPGVSITLASSDAGTDYQLIYNGTAILPVVSGTGNPIVFSGNYNAGTYSIVATQGICSNSMTGTFSIQASASIVITQNPTDVTITAGGSTSFAAAATYPDSPLSYQWQFSQDGINFTDLVDGINYSGVNSPSLTVSNATAAFNGNQYRCMFSETICNTNVASLAATLTVAPALVINTYLPTITGAIPGSTVSIPVTVENLVDVAGISLAYSFDNAVLTYQGYSSLFPGLSAGIFDFNAVAGGLRFAWFDVTPVSLASGTLFNIDFTFNGGSSILGWNTSIAGDCQYVDLSSNILNANFYDGAISGCSLPLAFNVTGGGTMCSSGIGLEIGLDGSESGTNYTLYFDGVATSQSQTGTGSAISFGLQTLSGTYGVVGASTCSSTTMTGTASINFFAPPSMFTVTGGGAYCAGTTAPSVGLDGSETSVTYTLYINGVATGLPVAGTGSALDFGAQSATGTYTVHGANTCITTIMGGSASVNTNGLPATYAVVGGGNYCTGGAGLSVQLAGSTLGDSYDLYLDGSYTGTSLSGTGSALAFANQTTAGNYTVVATNGCGSVGMSGSVNIIINPGPQVFAVSGGGSYCTGGAGVVVGLSGSETGAAYTLFFDGMSMGSTIPGTGNSISFGLLTGVGSYTVTSTNACGTASMTGSVSISFSTIPAVFAMTGGGNYIAGGLGVDVGIDGSETGVNYSLYINGVFTGQVVPGNGAAISFGNQTTPGAYTVMAVNASSSCSSVSSGSATVSVTPIVITDPFSVTIFDGYNGSFSVTALGATIYQWQVSFDGGLTWVNLINGGTYANVDTPTLNILGATTGMDGYMYRCEVSNPGSPFVYSAGATLDVTPAPVLTTIAPTMTAAANTSILVPVDVLNYGGISAFNLTLTYDPAVLTYTGITNLNPAITTGNEIVFTNGAIPGQFFIAYFSITPSTIGDGKLFDIQFDFNNGFSPLIWKLTPPEGAQYANALAMVLPCVWINGSVNAGTSTPITVQPLNATACEGGSATYSITAPTASTYQWMATPDYGISWFDLVNSALFSGVNTNTLTVSGVSPSMTNFLFACKVDPGTATAGVSNPASLSITPFITVPGTIAALPGTTICPGNNVTFSVNAAYDLTGATYQWYVNSIPMVATPTFSSTALVDGDVVKVDVYVNGSCAFLSIPTLTMVVDPHPVVTSAPADVIAVIGDDPSFTVVASAPGASPLAYQWQISTDHGSSWTNLSDGSVYSGVTTATMHITDAIMAMDGDLFRCIVTEGTCLNTITSEDAQLFMFYGPIITKLDDQTVCGSSTMVVPIKVDNFIDVASISLKLNYDPAFLTYTGYQNVNPALVVDPFSLFTVSATATQVGIFGFSLTPVSLTNDAVMVELLFTPSPGTTTLDWDDQTFGSCMYTDLAGTTIPDIYINATTININPLPVIFEVTGGGDFCVGGIGQPVGLSGSEVGFTYELFNNNFTTFITLAGTGSALDFGYQLAAGVYTIIATNNTTACSQIMGSSALIVINPLPVVTFAGILETQCLGVTSYVLTGGTPAGGTYSGPGVLNGLFYPTVAGVGIHTITYSYSDPINGCINFASNTITVLHGPLPNTITGGGSYCAGGSGVVVGLSGSEIGMLYQTQINGVINGPYVGGTGFPITFGLQTIPGVYTILGTDPNTACTLVMTNSVTVVVDPLPTAFTVTGGGNYCTGGNGVSVGLANSESGVNYALYLYGVATGQVVAGTGTAISFGSQLTPGVYSVYAVNTATTCENWMTGNVNVVVYPLPVVFTVTGGGSVCTGQAGVNVGLSGSQIAVNYELYFNGGATSLILGGTGMSLNFGIYNQAGTYTVVATDMVHGCVNNMTGSATVTSNPLPTAFNLTGGGAYCIDGSGVVIGLSGSENGVNYQLVYNGISLGNPVAGTGSAISFGNQLQAGTYTVVATNVTTTCYSLMTGTLTVSINALPFVSFAGYQTSQCITDTTWALTSGFPVGGTYSGPGVSGNEFDASAAGLGVHQLTYTYTNPATGCTNFATNYITVNANPAVTWSASLPNVCADENGYVLSGGFPLGGVYSGPGVNGLVFDATAVGPGTYTLTYLYTNIATGCFATATQTITVDPLPDVTWNGSLTALCADAAAVTLTGGLPAGGTYSGPGVAGNTFNPALVGPGTYTLTYTYTNPVTNCTGFVTNIIIVNPLPLVTFGGKLETQCSSSTAYLLTTGFPAGGTYSGAGVTGNIFNASAAGLGVFALTYTYTDTITGCTNFAFNDITVVPGPSVAWTALLLDQCADATNYILPAGTPANGVFSGPGVTGNVFNASLVGPGTYTLTYSYTFTGSGCSGSTSNTIVVLPLPTLTWGTALTSQCITSTSYTLTGTSPSNGTYSGPGVVGNNFNASAAGLGLHTITYTFTDANGCTNSITNTITVNPLPTVSFGVLSAVCVSQSAFALTTGSPAGGTYSGNGVSSGNFNPAVAGVGTHTLTYTYSSGSGCTASATTTITVYSLPTVTLSPIAAVCINTAAFTLTNGSPAGGTYSGTGISAGIFNPANAGAGTHTITYTVTNANNCTASATTTITVNPLPVVSWGNALTAQCVSSVAYALTGGTPAGGTYSGPGVNGNNFNAALVGALYGTGSFTLTYTYTNANGCSASATNTITVNALPIVTWTGTLADQCASATTYTLSGGTPAGGTYSGPGVTGTNFNASLTGSGVHTLTYTYTNPTTGCSNSTTKTITVTTGPNVYWTNILASPCQNVTAVVLGGATPPGGTYSGPGVTSGVFNPQLVGPGNYTFTYTYTDALGCTGTATNTITVNALPNVVWNNVLTTQCADNGFYLLSGGTPAGGTYSGPGVFGNNFDASNIGAGTYTLTYTYTTAAGCTNYANNTITVAELPTVTLGPNQNICFGSSTTITATATAGVTFVWSTGASTPSITVVVGDTSTYSVTVTNSFGCTATATMNVNMLPLPNAQTSVLPKTICQGESATIFASGGSGLTPYVWATGQTASSFVSNNNQDTTVFVVTVTNIFGCQSVSSVKLNVNVVPVVQLNGGVAQFSACNFTIANLVPGPGPYDTYLWNTGEQTPNLNVATDELGASTFNTFSVTVTLNGCQAKDDIILFVDPCGAINEVGTQQIIEIYPNPTDGMFTINLENLGEGMTFDIYNNLGQNIYNEKLTNDMHSRYTKNFDLRSYPVGIYFLRFADGDKVYSRKLIVK